MKTGITHGLAGLNGAGKTTLLNALFGFLKPKEGIVSLDGRPLQRRDIAYLEAENFFYPFMTGREYLELFNPSSAAAFNMDSWQELLSLPLDQVTESYSTGMKKRLALLGVIKLDKPVLILDEPFNGLDMEGTHLLAMILERLHRQGKTIIVTSHIYETLTGCCMQIHYLVNGVIEQSFTPPEYPLLQERLRETVEGRSLGHLERVL
jgi:ABC-2 type transport system ATP-binding protein